MKIFFSIFYFLPIVLLGQVRNNESKDSIIVCYVDQMATFPGGDTELNLFLTKNLIVPQSALDYNIRGTCYIEFCIETDGTIENLKIIRGVQGCPECDKEVLRVFKMMPKWIPGKSRGCNVPTNIMLPIKFKVQ